jgi:murein DD-endopeptidase MepM/ murein hydrolase activator NlpD
MRLQILVLIAFLSLSSVSRAQECNICKVVVPSFQAHYNAARYDSIFAMFSPEMQAFLPLSQTRELFGQLQGEAGKLISLQFRGYKKGGYAYYRGGFEKTIMELDFSINGAAKIDGLMLNEYDSLKPVQRNKTVLSLPFKGEWYVNAGGDTKEQNLHLEALAQRRAFDIVIRDKAGKTFRNKGERNEDYYAFGQELYAPAAGEVVMAIDGLFDNVPGDMNRMYIPGNSVVIKTADSEYLFFAHFKQGSVRVKKGQTVVKGTLLGLCGNSGNSSEPHLHFHIQDGPDINTAVGKKCYFDAVKVNGVLKKDYSPVKDERISPATP